VYASWTLAKVKVLFYIQPITAIQRAAALPTNQRVNRPKAHHLTTATPREGAVLCVTLPQGSHAVP
jgi:hypothetical protein